MYIRSKYFLQLTIESVKSQRKYNQFHQYRELRNKVEPAIQPQPEPTITPATQDPPQASNSGPDPLEYTPLNETVAEEIRGKPLGPQILEVHNLLMQAQYS